MEAFADRPATKIDETVQALAGMIDQHRRRGQKKLPIESILCSELAVSRYTLREALSRLEAAGEISRRRGQGTLVLEPKGHWPLGADGGFPANVVLSLSEFLSNRGVDYRVRELRILHEAAWPDAASALGLDVGAPIYHATRLYEVDHVATAYLEHVLPTHIKGQEVHIHALTEGVTTFLERVENLEIAHVDSTITAERADPSVARRLYIEEGSPLLVMYTRIFTVDETVIALGRLVFRPELLSLSVTAQGGLDLGRSLDCDIPFRRDTSLSPKEGSAQ
jgi:GntR family transcriptional regulator